MDKLQCLSLVNLFSNAPTHLACTLRAPIGAVFEATQQVESTASWQIVDPGIVLE